MLMKNSVSSLSLTFLPEVEMNGTFLSGVLFVCVGIMQANGGEKPPPPERYYVVRHTDIDKTERVEIMSAEDVKTLTDEIRVEAPLLQKAVDSVRAQWSRDAALKRTPFPKSLFAPRKMDPPGIAYDDLKKAERKMDGITKSMADAQSKRTAKAKPSSTEKSKSKDGELDKSEATAKAMDMVRAELEKMKDAAATKAAAAAGGGAAAGL